MKTTNLLKSVTCAIVFLVTSAQSSASIIVASGDSNLSNVSRFYSNMFSGYDVFATSGWSVGNTSSSMSAAAKSFTSGVLSAAALTGKEWFVASTNNTYSSNDLSIIKNYVNEGGNLFVIGEEANSYAAMDVVANAVLGAVGSAMTIGNPQSAPGTWTSSGSNIGVSSLTSGMTSFGGNYAATVIGGSTLFKNNANGIVILAEEEVASQVPEPATIALFGFGLLGLAASRRKSLNSKNA